MYPQSFEEAVESSEFDNWMIPMKDHNFMNYLTEDDTFTLTHLPAGGKAVGGRWVYTNKENPITRITGDIYSNRSSYYCKNIDAVICITCIITSDGCKKLHI